MSGTHLLAHWSRTQSCVALSSGEAELNAMLKAACEGLNLKYLHDEIGEERMLHLRGIPRPRMGPSAREAFTDSTTLASRKDPAGCCQSF